MKALTTTKNLLNALNLIDSFGFETECITNIEFVESSYKTSCNIIKFSYDYSEKSAFQWFGEYFTKPEFVIIKHRSRTIKTDDGTSDIYRVMYGSSKGINEIKCESKEKMEEIYNQIRTEELIENYHFSNSCFDKIKADELGLDLEGRQFHL